MVEVYGHAERIINMLDMIDINSDGSKFYFFTGESITALVGWQVENMGYNVKVSIVYHIQ